MEVIDDNGKVLSFQVSGSNTLSFLTAGDFVLSGSVVRVETLDPLSSVSKEIEEESRATKALKDPLPLECQPGTFVYDIGSLNVSSPVDRSYYFSTCVGSSIPEMTPVEGDLCLNTLEHDTERARSLVNSSEAHSVGAGCLEQTECTNGCSLKNFGIDICGSCGIDVSALFPQWLSDIVNLDYLNFSYPCDASLTYSTVSIPYLGIEWVCTRIIYEICIPFPTIKTYQFNVPVGNEQFCQKWEPEPCTDQTSCISYYYKPCNFSYSCQVGQSVNIASVVPSSSISIGTSVPLDAIYQVVSQDSLLDGSGIGHVLLDPKDSFALPRGPVTYISSQTNIARDLILRLQAPKISYISSRNGRGFKGLLSAQIEVKNALNEWDKFESDLSEEIQWNLTVYDCKNMISGESVISPIESKEVQTSRSKVSYNIKTNSLLRQRAPVRCLWDLEATLEVDGQSYDVFDTTVIGKDIYFGLENKSDQILFEIGG